MFGIGRSSPQSSLASLLTIPHTESLLERSPDGLDNVAICSDRPQDIGVSEEISRPSEDQVTIIRGNQPEPRSVANSSRTSATNAEPTEPTVPPETRVVPSRSTYEEENSSATKILQQQVHVPQRSHTSSPTHSFLHTRSAARKFVERLRRGKLWQKLRNGKHSDSRQTISLPLTQDAQTMTEPAVDFTMASNAENITVSHTPTIAISDADERPPATPYFVQRRQEFSPMTIEAQDLLAIKLGRIQNQRKEATLKDKFFRRPTCLCGEGCHCKDDGSNPTTTAQTPDRSASLSNSYRHPLGPILLSSSTSSSSSAGGRTQHHNPSRHVAFTDNYLEPSNPSFPLRLISSEDDEQQQVSRQSTTTSMSATSQVTTAVNSSSSGSARNTGLPNLSDQHIDQLVDLFRLDPTRPRTRDALRVLRASRQPLELSTSQHSSQNVGSRTNSVSIASEEGSNGRVNSVPRNSTTSLSNLPEPRDMHVSHSEIHDATAATAVGRTHSSSEATVQPHSPQDGHPSLPDQLSADLEQLANHNQN